jgi:hypothetical protein
MSLHLALIKEFFLNELHLFQLTQDMNAQIKKVLRNLRLSQFAYANAPSRLSKIHFMLAAYLTSSESEKKPNDKANWRSSYLIKGKSVRWRIRFSALLGFKPRRSVC